MMSEEVRSIRVVVLSGEEFQRLERLKEITDAVVEPATRDFNFDTLSAEGFSLDKLAELVITFPMMAERRVIVIRDYDKVHPETRKKAGKIIADTPETTFVIVEGEKATVTPKPPKEYLLSESFRRIYDNKLPTWIKERFKKRGKKVSDRAVAHIINNVGDNLGELDGEVEKVTTAVGDETVVDETVVERVVGSFKRHTVWAFCNAVGIGDFREAVNILENLMEMEKNRESWYLSSLFSHVVKIAEYNRLLKQGTPQKEAMKTVTESTFLWKLNKMDHQTRNINDRMARRILTVLGRTESTLKKSGLDNRLLMELMLPYVIPRPGK
ncbi:DNA polymerase III subunit delta [Candidatus Latescibacterota bacterium]